MKILEDTLEIIPETWEDPGDYPSGAGSGPLPSCKYVAEIGGRIVMQLEPGDIGPEDDRWEKLHDLVSGQYDLPYGVAVLNWKITDPGGDEVIFEVDSFEAKDWTPDEPSEPEYDRFYGEY